MTNREVFPKRLKQYMEEARVNQTELANAVGVSKSTVHCWLKGKSYPRIDIVQKVADFLGCRTDDLLTKVSVTSILFNGSGTLEQGLSPEIIEQALARKKEEEELNRLWKNASLPAKRAAIAVLKSMESEG